MEIINPMGKKEEKVTTKWEGRELELTVNKVGFRATSSVLVKYGETVVLGSVVVSPTEVDQDFFPLSIDYEEKWYAAGKISIFRVGNLLRGKGSRVIMRYSLGD